MQESFANIIKKLQEKHEVSNSELARRLGVKLR